MLNLVAFAVAALGCVILAALLEHRTGLPSAVVLVVVGLQVWREARTAAVEAGLRRLDELTAEEPSDQEVADLLRRRARERDQLGEAWAGSSSPGGEHSSAARAVRLRRQMIDAEATS